MECKTFRGKQSLGPLGLRGVDQGRTDAIDEMLAADGSFTDCRGSRVVLKVGRLKPFHQKGRAPLLRSKYDRDLMLKE